MTRPASEPPVPPGGGQPGQPVPPGGQRPGPYDVAGWHRLHPLSPLIRTGRHVFAIGILILLLIFAGTGRSGQRSSDLISDLVIIGVVLVAGVVSWLVTRWQVADGVLRIETGLIRRQSLRFPLSQVQAIDVVQTGLARVFGLAELRFRMAGSGASEGRLACLPLAQAEQLRHQLLAVGQEASTRARAQRRGGTAPARAAAPARTTVRDGATARDGADRAGAPAAVPPAPERVLFRTRSGQLAAAVVLSSTGAVAAVVIAGMACAAALTGQPGVVARYLPIGIAVLLAVWRRFNGQFGTVVTAAHDGLRLRSGLVQTTAETIRPGRVQGVRLVEPLVWRAFGWCRVEVDIAGPRQRREDRSESRRMRALVPVGTRDEAAQMIAELVPGRPLPFLRAPARARWKAPLTYHFLGWENDDRYAVASRGRVRRETTWVPLEKVQSIRWAQGPLQRRLGLASVRLDVAGKRVTASAQDRDATEAADLLRLLPALARSARARA